MYVPDLCVVAYSCVIILHGCRPSLSSVQMLSLCLSLLCKPPTNFTSYDYERIFFIARNFQMTS